MMAPMCCLQVRGDKMVDALLVHVAAQLRCVCGIAVDTTWSKVGACWRGAGQEGG